MHQNSKVKPTNNNKNAIYYQNWKCKKTLDRDKLKRMAVRKE